MKIKNIVSFGAGVNSGALLSILKIKKIKIDECIYADTKTNWDSEYKWIEQEVKPYLKKENIKFTIIHSDLNSSLGKGNLYGFYYDKKMIPPVSRRECTDKFKITPIINYIKKVYPNDLTMMYIGYDSDEPLRAKRLTEWKEKNNNKRLVYKKLPYIPVYPLLQYNITRDKCKELIKIIGLKVPEKSRCYICPFMKEEGFIKLLKEEPHNFEKALKLEENGLNFNKKNNWNLLNNDKKQLRLIKQKYKEQSKLVNYFEIPHLMIEYKEVK